MTRVAILDMLVQRSDGELRTARERTSPCGQSTKMIICHREEKSSDDAVYYHTISSHLVAVTIMASGEHTVRYADSCTLKLV
jgi:hypothetical protein